MRSACSVFWTVFWRAREIPGNWVSLMWTINGEWASLKVVWATPALYPPWCAAMRRMAPCQMSRVCTLNMLHNHCNALCYPSATDLQRFLGAQVSVPLKVKKLWNTDLTDCRHHISFLHSDPPLHLWKCIHFKSFQTVVLHIDPTAMYVDYIFDIF